MREHDWEREKKRFTIALDDWTDYKRRLLASGFGTNVSGLESWHVLGLGMCCRLVKGACCVDTLTSNKQGYDGWVLVRSMWETSLDVAYIAVQPSYEMRDALATRYVRFDDIRRLEYARNNGLEPKPEWVTAEKNWNSTYKGNKKKWHGLTTTSIIKCVAGVVKVETLDRMGPIVDLAKAVSDFTSHHWWSSSNYTHGDPLALGRLWKSEAAPAGWTDGADSCDHAFCLHESTFAFMAGCKLYAITSPVPSDEVRPPTFDFDA